ncbi:MAG: hypothetical protein K8H88_22135 [Sandaracinaceae bacterium]|nr:hypothetical protein [Sandaracinaceae bacterium]
MAVGALSVIGLLGCGGSTAPGDGGRDATVLIDGGGSDAGSGTDAGGGADAGSIYDMNGCLTFAGASTICGFSSDDRICALSVSCGSSTDDGQCKINCEMGTTVRCYREADVTCLEAAADCTALAACGWIL